ncbi:hypothetical protein ACFE04_019679 [Oxalis oulophora]
MNSLTPESLTTPCSNLTVRAREGIDQRSSLSCSSTCDQGKSLSQILGLAVPSVLVLSDGSKRKASKCVGQRMTGAFNEVIIRDRSYLFVMIWSLPSGFQHFVEER